jgi:hypothetical protein
MVVHDLHSVRGIVAPNEADTPLIVDAYAVLSFAITGQRFEPIARRRRQIAETLRSLQHPQLTPRDSVDALEPTDPTTGRQGFGISVAIGYDHKRSILRIT